MESPLFKREEIVMNNGINLDFVDQESSTLTENFICSICLNLVVNPVFCVEGECIFCSSCIEGWNKKDKKCPNCRNIFKANLKVSRILKNVLYKIKLKCFFSSDGCLNKVEYEIYENHIKNCEFGNYLCAIEGCNFKSKKKEMIEHIEKCDFLIVSCEFCKQLIPKNIINDHYNLCNKYKKFCPVCKENVQNSDIGSHNNGICYKELSSLFLNNSIHKNLETSVYISEFSDLKSNNIILQQKLTNIDEIISKLKEELHDSKTKNTQLLNDIHKIKKDNFNNINSNVNNIIGNKIVPNNIVMNNFNNNNVINNLNNINNPINKNPALCINNLHNFVFSPKSITGDCVKCKKDRVNCRFECRNCKVIICYKCNIPTEKNKCPVGHILKKIHREVSFCCDVCLEHYDEGVLSNCDKECDIDICEACFKKKDCLIF